MLRQCRTVLAGLLFLPAGCYSYRPVELVPEPGTEVRIVFVASTEVTTLAPGPAAACETRAGVFEVSGAIVAATDSTVAVRLGELWVSTGRVRDLDGQVAFLPVHRIGRIERRHFRPGRTIFVGVGLSTVAVSLFLVVVLGEMFQGS